MADGRPWTEYDKNLTFKPVIVLCILNFTLFPETLNYTTFHYIVESETKKSYVPDLRWVFVELPKFTKPEESISTVEEHWLSLFNTATMYYDIPDNVPKEIQKAY